MLLLLLLSIICRLLCAQVVPLCPDKHLARACLSMSGGAFEPWPWKSRDGLCALGLGLLSRRLMLVCRCTGESWGRTPQVNQRQLLAVWSTITLRAWRAVQSSLLSKL